MLFETDYLQRFAIVNLDLFFSEFLQCYHWVVVNLFSFLLVGSLCGSCTACVCLGNIRSDEEESNRVKCRIVYSCIYGNLLEHVFGSSELIERV